jgi:rod shape-determining protein MreD
MDKVPGIRPRSGLWHQLDVASRYAFPSVCTAVVLLLLSAPLGIPGQAQLQPAWALATVWFWSLFRPASMPAFAVFGLGLLLDLIAGGPVGVQVLILLLVHGAAVKSRRSLIRSGFALVWLAFMTAAAAAALLEWGLIALLTWQALPPWPALFEFGVAVGIYPVLATLLTGAHRGVAAPERA